jgi:hypothetical protein
VPSTTTKVEDVAMSEDETNAKSDADVLRDIFQGVKGRLPQTDMELQQWLDTPEGKAATVFHQTTVSRWGEVGRS